MTVFGYSRVSTTDQAEGTSLNDQRAKIEWVVDGMERPKSVPRPQVQHYADPGVSGSSRMSDRPQGGYMIELLSRGDTLIVAKLDRAFRSAEDALRTARELQERGVDLIVADISHTPVTNGVGKMFFTMLAALAEFERERILERTLEGRRGKRARGGFVGGTVPFGYLSEGEGRDARLVEVPAEQAAIESILELREAGLSLRDVAEQVNERHGTSISYQVVRRVERDHRAQQEQEADDE